ncbi:zinc finger protein 142-like [Zophobas morio]|uniref:zinc finger protein 142-like n=1 Tax=Zophobas morio TaxID=2755281 RepID=UPI003083B837
METDKDPNRLESVTSSPTFPNYFHCSKTLTSYYCDQCVFNSQLLVDLKHHTYEHLNTTLKKHRRTLIQVCEQCSYKTHSLLMLFNHYIRNHNSYINHKLHKCKRCPLQCNLSNFSCKKCSFTTNWKCLLYKHMSSHVGEDSLWVMCAFCPFKTRQESSLKRHIRALHTSVEQIPLFECKVCQHKTIRADHMKRHMREVHSCYIYKVEHKINKKEFTDRDREIPKVLAINCPQIQESGHNVFLCAFCNGHNVFQCVFCPLKTVSRRCLSKHIQEAHEKNKYVEKKAAVTFQCDQCSFSTEWMNTLKMHNLLKHQKKDLFMNLMST